VSIVEQELLTMPDDLISSLVFSGDVILFLVVICGPLVVILFFCLLVIALSVLCPSISGL